jgi:poly(3-hydroxybutyrate) depolymerase
MANSVLAFGLVGLLAAGSAATQGSRESALQTIEIDGRARSYRVHLPHAYDGRKPLPLVLALHGGGGSADGWFCTGNRCRSRARIA